jgi:hypothetical protein
VTSPDRDSGGQQHGNVFGRGWGNMFIHVQRESGLAHRTMVLRPWQVQALRLVVSRWFAAVLTVALLSWAYFAVQTARVSILTRRITHLEQDAAKIDTLQATLEQLQRRYAQVQQMMSAAARTTPAVLPAAPKPPATPGKPSEKSLEKTPGKGPVKNPEKVPGRSTDTTTSKAPAAAH